ncbi:MAG TPA: ABC transporter ATP-binding protein [Chloroflexota bacterium]|nr:ABC transporter ATP-binding protein [Chloroflexota bacterium]
MTTAAVELSGAWKRYGSVAALQGVDLTIEAGETVAILGPNGAGKTTAISLMLGLRRPSAGEARLFGWSPTDRRARSRCGVMLQESGVPGMLRVRELVDLFRSYYPAPLPLAEVLGMAGLEGQAGQQVRELSGGQRQRLYFALAVSGDPQALFLDEPTVGMDVEARRAFLETIKGFARAGKTIVLTTHYLEEADQVAERIVVVDRGRIVADAPPAGIKSRVGLKRVTFRAGGGLAAGLAGLPVQDVVVEDGGVRFLSAQPEAVLRALFGRGVEIRDLEVVGAGLEEAFLRLTAQGDNAAAEGPAGPAGVGADPEAAAPGGGTGEDRP